jgi:hypothetical protein
MKKTAGKKSHSMYVQRFKIIRNIQRCLIPAIFRAKFESTPPSLKNVLYRYNKNRQQNLLTPVVQDWKKTEILLQISFSLLWTDNFSPFRQEHNPSLNNWSSGRGNAGEFRPSSILKRRGQWVILLFYYGLK